MSGPLEVAVTHLPAATGIHRWLEPAVPRTLDDLALARRQGFASVRLHLAWDAFMPTDRRVDARRLQELGTVLEGARALDIGVELVLFMQSFAGCVQLPGYAVDRRRPRPGVSVLVEGIERPGGPRDPYADPLMLEVQERWLAQLLAAFAGHPAVRSWDLGHDPASTARPRRTAQLASWCSLLADVAHRQQEAVHLTLGAGDVLGARGVRLAAVAPHLDAVGLLLRPAELPLLPPADTGERAAFCAALALRLAQIEGRVPPLRVVTGLPVDDDPGAPPSVPPLRARPGAEPAEPVWDVIPLVPPEGRRRTESLLARLGEVGVAAVTATSWTVGGPRTLEARPWSTAPSHAREGVSDPDGDLREHGEVWARWARSEPSAAPPVPLGEFDVEQYYANLPDSALELWERWRRGSAAPS